MRNLQYSGDKYQLATGLLRHLNVPSHYASISLDSHDTGYPGLTTQVTSITLRPLEDNELETLIYKLFQRMGFE